MKKLFIHIPKNGGTTIRKNSNIKRQIMANHRMHVPSDHIIAVSNALTKMGFYIKDFCHARWLDITNNITSKHQAFAIVRNPWDRIVSRYLYGLNKIYSDQEHNPGLDNVFSSSLTFEEFLQSKYKYENLPYLWYTLLGWYSQLDFVTNEQGELKCDILRFEHLGSDITKYFKLLTPPSIQNVNNGILNENSTKVVNKIDYRTFYTEETQQLIYNWYKKEINFFGFTFDGSATKNIWNNFNTFDLDTTS